MTPKAETEATDAAEPGHAGHRQRLRDRFMTGGADALPDYELLELLLFWTNPRKDTKPQAKRLLGRFGTFAGVISAPPAQLATEGLSDNAIALMKVTQAGAVRLSRQNVMSQPILSSWSALLDYLRAAMAHEANEQFRLLFLDRKNRLIRDEVQARGTVDHTPVYVREVVKRALELHATAIILVHNHPSGDPTPSPDDVAMTQEIRQAARALSITLHDHVIVGNGRWLSLRQEGLL